MEEGKGTWNFEEDKEASGQDEELMAVPETEERGRRLWQSSESRDT